VLNYCTLWLFGWPTQLTASKLASITEAWLVEWFINSYLYACAQLCTDSVSRLFEDISTATKLQRALSAVADQRSAMAPFEFLVWFTTCQFYITDHVPRHSVTLRSCLLWMKELAKAHRCLPVYFTAVTFLHIARKLRNITLRDELLDVLATTWQQSNDARRCRRARHSSVLSLSQAAMLMKVVATNSRSTVRLIEIELSKAYLYRALRCDDSDSDSIYGLANVYLAVLYLLHYRTTLDGDRSLYTGDEVTKSLTVQFTCCTRRNFTQYWRWRWQRIRLSSAVLCQHVRTQLHWINIKRNMWACKKTYLILSCSRMDERKLPSRATYCYTKGRRKRRRHRRNW